jgi:D-aminopeptidase
MAARARELGIVVGQLPTGDLNAITDVAGVRVGHSTIIHGDGSADSMAARTGVTAIHPHEASVFRAMVPAAIEVLNGSGEITGRSQVDEYGYIESPILITNTFSVGAAHQAVTNWLCDNEPTLGSEHFIVPVVAETYDGFLNDVRGQHVREEHVRHALDSASSGPVEEGNVGGGTGMSLFQFKGGAGTSSRIVEIQRQPYTLGVYVQANTGRREDLTIAGVPVGQEISDLRPTPGGHDPDGGSIIVVIATDAPLSDRQCRRLCMRGMMGLGRVGLKAGNSSGDLLIAFSNNSECRLDRFSTVVAIRPSRLDDRHMNGLFNATVEATAEAVLNALVAAETLTGHRGNTVYGIPQDRLLKVLNGSKARIA